MENDPKPQQQLIEEVSRKQRNIVWPDTMVNGRSVDEYLWKGSPDAPLVQRVGAWLFGLTFMLLATALIEATRESPERGSPASAILVVFIAVLFFLVGLKVFINGFRLRKRNTQKIDD